MGMINLLECSCLCMRFWFLILGFFLVGFTLAYAIPGDVNMINTESKLGNDKTLVGKQVMIAADVINNQDSMQSFAYITQIKNDSGIVISLSWLTGSLSPNQSLSPAQSWTPIKSGNYTIEVFVWKSIDNPDALSPPLYMKLEVVEEYS